MYTELKYPVTTFDNKTVLHCNGVDSKLSHGIGFHGIGFKLTITTKFECYSGTTCTNFRNNRLLLSKYFVYTVSYIIC